MSVDELDLLVRAVHREWIRDSKSVDVRDSSIFFGGASHIHIFTVSNRSVWPTIGGAQFECNRPFGLFSGKQSAKFKATMQIINDMRVGRRGGSSVEELICQHIPVAKDIIAEKALVDDHKP